MPLFGAFWRALQERLQDMPAITKRPPALSGRTACFSAQASGLFAATARQFVKRHFFIDANILRQAKHLLGDNIPQDFVRTTGNA